MVAKQLSAFTGAMPIMDPRLLPDTTPIEAVNVRTDGGSLKPITAPSLIKTISGTTNKVYKLPYNSLGNPIDPSNMLDARWLEFADIDTDVLRGPTINDSFQRYYLCSPSLGFRYQTLAGLLAGTAPIPAGVEVPLTPLVVGPTGGGVDSPIVTRAYIQTFVSVYGEEGQPGPSFEVAGKSDADWIITSIDQPVNGAGTTQIDRIRIYRTITSAAGVTTFYRVTTFPIGTTTFNDNLSDAVVSANQIIESTLWAPPPAGLQGIVAMPNGIFVGWVGSTLYFSENYRPHAWPAEYALAVQFPVVGLGVFGTTCVVCTTGNPATITGIKSSVMALTQGKVSMPCMARKSIVSTLEGVYYASNDGLVLIAASGAGVATQQIIARDQWINDYKPKDIKALHSRGVYSAIRGTDGFMLPTGVQPSTQNGVVAVSTFTTPKNMGIDEFSSKGWVIDGTSLLEWEPATGDKALLRWLSKEFTLPVKGNLSVYQVYFDKTSPPGNEGVNLKVWAGGNLIYNQPVLVSEKEYRLPSGFKEDIWQFELTSRTRIHNFNVASTPLELRNG